MLIVKKFLFAETNQEGNCRPHTNGGGARSQKGQRRGKILANLSHFVY